MSDVKQIDPKVFEYLAKPESERVAKPSEHFASPTPVKRAPVYQISFCLDFFDDNGVRRLYTVVPLLGVSSEEMAKQRFREFKVDHPSDVRGHIYSEYPVLEKVEVLATWQNK